MTSAQVSLPPGAGPHVVAAYVAAAEFLVDAAILRGGEDDPHRAESQQEEMPIWTVHLPILRLLQVEEVFVEAREVPFEGVVRHF